MNKNCFCWSIFSGLNDWNIIIFNKISLNNNKNNNMIFEIILRKIEVIMSDGILSTIYGTMRVDDENTDEYFVVQ